MKMAVFGIRRRAVVYKCTEASGYSVCSLIGVGNGSSRRQPTLQLYRVLMLGLQKCTSLAVFQFRLAIRIHGSGVRGCWYSYITHWYQMMVHSDKQLTLRNCSSCLLFMFVSLNWIKPNRYRYDKTFFHFVITLSVRDDSALLVQAQ
jgi:hypothetical protein